MMLNYIELVNYLNQFEDIERVELKHGLMKWFGMVTQCLIYREQTVEDVRVLGAMAPDKMRRIEKNYGSQVK